MESTDQVELSLKDRGNAELQAGNYEKAIEYYSMGINIDEENYLLYSNRSAAYAKLEKWREALDDATRTTQLQPTWPKGYTRKALALHYLGRYQEAKICYSKAIDLEPGNAQTRAALQDVIKAEQIALSSAQATTNSQIPPSDTSSQPVPESTQDTTTQPEVVPDVQPKSPRREIKVEISSEEEKEKEKEPENTQPLKITGDDTMKFKKDDINYYDILGIPKDATTAQIKKAYYQKARDFHPDKNADNPEGEEMFKLISQAYSVLSDEKKRKTYDLYGMDGLRASEQGEMVDPSIIFKMIFGGGAFDDIFGELSFARMAKDAMETMEGLSNGMSEEEILLKVEKENILRKEKLVEELLKKLDPHINAPDRHSKEKAFEGLKQDVLEKLDAPGGPVLLSHTYYIYIQEAKKNHGRLFGVEGFFAGLQETGHAFKQQFSLISSFVQFQVAQEKLEQHGEQNEALESQIMSHGLNTIWKLGLFEIEGMVRDVCQFILRVNDKKLKKKRASALRDLGEFYRREVKLAKKRGIDTASPHFDFFGKEEDTEKDKSEKDQKSKENETKEKAKVQSRQKS